MWNQNWDLVTDRQTHAKKTFSSIQFIGLGQMKIEIIYESSTGFYVPVLTNMGS